MTPSCRYIVITVWYMNFLPVVLSKCTIWRCQSEIVFFSVVKGKSHKQVRRPASVSRSNSCSGEDLFLDYV